MGMTPPQKPGRRGNATDPYHDKRTYHMAHMHDGKGGVSPLCSKKIYYKLNLKKHQMWTLRWEAVDCKKCLALK